MAGELSAVALRAERAARGASRSATAWLLLAPSCLALVVLFVVPIGYVLLLSVTDPRLSLAHYQRIFTVPVYTRVMVNTFVTSLIVTAFCLVIGYPIAYVMARRGGRLSGRNTSRNAAAGRAPRLAAAFRWFASIFFIVA